MEELAQEVVEQETATEAPVEEIQEDTQEIEAEEVQEEEAVEVQEEEKEDDVPVGVKKRIDKVTRDKYDALREAEYWKSIAQQANQKQEPEPVQAPPQQQIQPEQFETYEEYTAAVAKQSAVEAVQQYQQQQQQHEQQSRIQSNLEAAKEKYEDFETVVGNPSVPTLNPQLQQAVYNSSEFADIAYHLASHPSKVKELNRMPPVEAVMKLGAILTEVKNAPPKQPKAPRPPKKVKSGGEPVHRNPEEMDIKEWVKLRNEGKI